MNAFIPKEDISVWSHWHNYYQRQSKDQENLMCFLFSRYRFQTELGYDFLEIHDGPNLLSALVGSFNGTQVPQFLFSSSNFLYLLFTTDNSRSNAGFKILYESKSETNKLIDAYTHEDFVDTE